MIAKHARADIVPVAIADFTGYPQLRPFKRRKLSIHIGKPISYELSDEEIIYQWCKQISEMSDYENSLPNPSQEKEIQEV